MSYFSIHYPTISDVPMRIRVFLSWNDPETIKKNIETEFNLFDIPGYKRDFELTSGEDYTHAIIINTFIPPNLHIDKRRVIGFAWEPTPLLGLNPQFISYAKDKIGRYFIGQKYNLGEPFEEKYAFINHNPIQKTIPLKNKICSFIFSKKRYMEGHQYRHLLVEAILKTNLPIDIWGRGCETIKTNDSRLKYDFVQNSVIPYENYQFHICIENISLDHYFSEKIVNALLSECTPIYYGCKKIDEYFPDKFVELNGNIENDISVIRNCIENPEIYRKKICKEDVNKIVNPFINILSLYPKTG
uniref:Fucosyltransferase C-terminal domain-containing protein n=1 Tax=viral metagenome TaxID=1070528 RepID=A0A6C0HYU1_9ZZZZ